MAALSFTSLPASGQAPAGETTSPTAAAATSGDDVSTADAPKVDLKADVVSQASATIPEVEPALLPDRPEDARLLLTGGLGGLHDGLNAFFRSPLFRAGRSVPLRVKDATKRALVSSDALFFHAEASVGVDELLAAADAENKKGKAARLFVGPSAIAFAPEAGTLDGAAATFVRRSMAGVIKTLAVESVVVDGRRLYGVALNEGEAVQWPDGTVALTSVPMATATFEREKDGKEEALFLIARRHGSTPRLFGELDRALAKDRSHTAYLDVGGTLASAEEAGAASIASIAGLVRARKPVAQAMGRSELVALSNAPAIVKALPTLVAAENIDIPSHRLVTVDKTRVLFVAVGGLGRQAKGLLPAGATAHSTEKSVAMAQKLATAENADVVVGIALSSAGERAALRAAIFDVVIHLTSRKVGGLPAQDLIDVRRNHAAGTGASATLVRHSRSDLTEIRLWRSQRGGLETISIGRTPIVGEGPEAADALEAIVERNKRRGWMAHEGEGLVARGALGDSQEVWTGKDLTRLLGSLIRTKTNADMSIIAVLEDPLAVEGQIPLPLARSWLSTDGRLRRTKVNGETLAQIFDALSSVGLDGRFYVNGASRSSKTVRERPIVPLEHYTIVYSPELAPALQERGVKIQADALAEDEKLPYVGKLVSGALFEGVDQQRAQDALDNADGVAEHVFVAELADVALSTSLHRIQGNENFDQVRDSRVLTPNYWAIGINGRATLAYDGPYNYSGLVASSQFSRQEQEGDGKVVIQEARDTLLLEAESRLLLKRVFDSSPRFTPEPGLRVSYQTEWTPNLVEEEDGTVTEQKRRSELRGFAGVTLRPTPLFEEIRAGAIVENDFASEAAGALEWGGEAALRGSYALWKLQISVESFLRGYVPDPANDTPDDLLLVGQAITRVELPVVFGLRLGVFADAYLAAGKVAEVRGPTTSLIVGASLSYGERLKFVPFR